MPSGKQQLTLPLGKPQPGQLTETVTVGRRVITARLVRHPRARHYVLRVLPDGSLRLTVPRYGTRAEARRFLEKQIRWIDSQRLSIRSDLSVMVAGERVPLSIEQNGAGSTVHFGGEQSPIRAGESPRAAACRRLREIARVELRARLHEIADRLGMPVKRVTIRSQQTRWGSCAPDGAISLNWRLVQTPPDVRDYVLIHELMHLRVHGHGKRFWQFVERECPKYAEAKKWLREHERELG